MRARSLQLRGVATAHERWRWFVLQSFVVYYDDCMRSVDVSDEYRWRRLFVYIRQVHPNVDQKKGFKRAWPQMPRSASCVDHQGGISRGRRRRHRGSSELADSCNVFSRENGRGGAARGQHEAAWMVENVNGNVPNGLVDPVTVRFADTPETKAQRQLQGHSRNGYAPQEYKRPPSDRILVSGLPAHLDLDFVKRIFDAYGTVRTCKLLGDGTAALVHFSSEEDASRVVQGLSGVIPNGLSSPVSVQFADSPAHPPPQAQSMGMMNIIVNGFMQAGVLPGRRLGNSEYAVYIAGLPSDTEDHHLYRLFACFGPIAPKGVRAMLNPDGTCTGIGFVNFLTPEAVQAAVTTFNGAILPDGTVLKVAMKTPKGHQS